MPPRWGLKSNCMVAGYKHAAPPALDALQAEVDALKRLHAGTAADILKREQRIAEIMGNIRNLLAKHGK